jgi:hypothetical protein
VSRLRTQVDRLEARLPTAPEPEPWDYLRDPWHRAYSIVIGLRVPLLEAEQAVEADPRREAIEAAATRREPILAGLMRDLSDALSALERGEPAELPTPTDEAITRARQYLWDETNPMIYNPPGLGTGSRLRRRNLAGGEVYDPTTEAGAVEVLRDAWAYRTLMLTNDARALYYHSAVHEGTRWDLGRRGLLDADGNLLPDEGES